MIEPLKKIILFSILGLMAASFLALGYDMPAQMNIRLPWIYLTLVLFAVSMFFGNPVPIKSLPVSFWCFAVFFLFEMIRAGYAIFALKEDQSSTLAQTFMWAPMWWGGGLGIFLLASSQLNQRKKILLFLATAGFACVFLAANALPALFSKGVLAYKAADGKSGFFFPVFYSMQWLPRYIFSRYAHPNNVSTIIAAGFIPMLALAFYSFLAWLDSFKQKEKHLRAEPNQILLGHSLLYFVLAGVIGSAVLLIQSRGGVVFFGAALFLFLGAIFLKYPSWMTGLILAFILFVGGAFFVWTGNLDKLHKELQTLEIESNAAQINPDEAVDHKGASIYANIAGKMNALKLYDKNPVWGVGYSGYMEGVKSLESEKGYERFQFAKVFAMSHYYQTLAEEGKGAFLYFLFLGVYLIEVTIKLLKTNSRFQFLAGLSLLCSALIMLGHASVNELLQRFTTSFILYAFMGASLACAGKQFNHE